MSLMPEDVASVDGDGDAPVLVVVVNNRPDLERAFSQGWYRIPLAHAPTRIGAEYLAFYQTGAFSEERRWRIESYAAVRRVQVLRRREILPDEPRHPRAGDLYYRIELGPIATLERPVVSRRLRRLTFLPTTLGRLLAAKEINDLWLRTSAQERLWSAFVQAGLEPEMFYPLREDDHCYVVDFAFLCRSGRIGLMLPDQSTPGLEQQVRDPSEAAVAYRSLAGNWTIWSATAEELRKPPEDLVVRLLELVDRAGGPLSRGNGPLSPAYHEQGTS